MRREALFSSVFWTENNDALKNQEGRWECERYCRRVWWLGANFQYGFIGQLRSTYDVGVTFHWRSCWGKIIRLEQLTVGTMADVITWISVWVGDVLFKHHTWPTVPNPHRCYFNITHLLLCLISPVLFQHQTCPTVPNLTGVMSTSNVPLCRISPVLFQHHTCCTVPNLTGVISTPNFPHCA